MTKKNEIKIYNGFSYDQASVTFQGHLAVRTVSLSVIIIIGRGGGEGAIANAAQVHDRTRFPKNLALVLVNNTCLWS